MKCRSILCLGLPALLSMLACGGGGSGPEPISATFAPDTFTTTYLTGDRQPMTYFGVTLSRAMSDSAHVSVNEDQPVLTDSGITIGEAHGTYVGFYLTPSETLSVGEHRGSFTLDVVEDGNHVSTQCKLPYHFTVNQGKAVTAAFDGQPVAGVATESTSITMFVDPNGSYQGVRRHLVELTCLTPVTWSYDVVAIGNPQVVTVLENTPTTWRAYVAPGDDIQRPAGTLFGTIQVHAKDAADTNNRTGAGIMLWLQVPNL